MLFARSDCLTRRWLAKHYSPPFRWTIVNYTFCLPSLFSLAESTQVIHAGIEFWRHIYRQFFFYTLRWRHGSVPCAAECKAGLTAMADFFSGQYFGQQNLPSSGPGLPTSIDVWLEHLYITDPAKPNQWILLRRCVDFWIQTFLFSYL